jgi:ribosomal-protein-alanine N-acetyltransferase
VLQLRAMCFEDVDAVYSIEVSAYRSPWGVDIFYDCILVNYDCQCLIEKKAQTEKLIGYIICRFDSRLCHILNIAIDPSIQGTGKGTFFLKQYLDSLDKRTVDMVILEVRPANVVALHVYQKIGFIEVGVKRGYYSDPGDTGEDALVLQKLIH